MCRNRVSAVKRLRLRLWISAVQVGDKYGVSIFHSGPRVTQENARFSRTLVMGNRFPLHRLMRSFLVPERTGTATYQPQRVVVCATSDTCSQTDSATRRHLPPLAPGRRRRRTVLSRGRGPPSGPTRASGKGIHRLPRRPMSPTSKGAATPASTSRTPLTRSLRLKSTLTTWIGMRSAS